MPRSHELPAPALTGFAPGVWLSTDPIRIVGMKLTTTMTVIQLPGKHLLLYSPVPLTAARREAVEALGRVAHLYAPNTFHHISVGPWAEAFPEACVHGPAALRAKRPDLRIDRLHDEEPPGELGESVEEIHIDGFALEESVLVHRASSTLLVADLVHNIGRPEHWWTVAYSRAMGFYDRVALSRLIRWTAFNDATAARRSLSRLSGCAFERLVPGHGAPLEQGAREAVLDAYRWLRDEQRLRLPAAQAQRPGWCG